MSKRTKNRTRNVTSACVPRDVTCSCCGFGGRIVGQVREFMAAWRKQPLPIEGGWGWLQETERQIGSAGRVSLCPRCWCLTAEDA